MYRCPYMIITARWHQAESDKPEPLGGTRKELPLAPGILLREANRRRASLSSTSGNFSDLLERSNSLKGRYKVSAQDKCCLQFIYSWWYEICPPDVAECSS